MRVMQVMTVTVLAIVLSGQTGAAGLFDNGLSKGEIAVIEERIAAVERSRRNLRKLRALFTAQEMQRGDCKEAIAIDGKAKVGDADAQWMLGQLHQAGLCVPKDFVTGAKWLEAAAQQGHDDAALLLALAYLQGQGVTKNTSTAYRWMRKGAEAGSPQAMVHLGSMLIDGEGAPVNPVEGASWLEKAAKERKFDANVRLAWLHLTGKLGAVNPAKAMEWGRPAAERGIPSGQMFTGFAAAELGKMVEAHKWMNLAASSDNPDVAQVAADERAKLEQRMKPADISEARRLASSWTAVTDEDELRKPTPVQTKQPSYDVAKAVKLSPEAAMAELVEIGVGIDKDAFFDAARVDNVGLFALFHRAGADLNDRLWPMGQTPLYIATDHDSQKVFDYLLQHKADVNVPADETGMTPLVRAISHQRPKMIDALLDAGASAKQLKGYGPEVSGSLLAGATALQYALMGRDTDPVLVRRLLDAGASVKEVYTQGRTTLMEAAEGNPHVFRLLLEKGADPNAVDQFGNTVLHRILAAETVSMENLKEALRAGAHATDWKADRVTPLVAAVVLGHAEAVTALLHAGAKPDLPMRIGHDLTPMNWGERERQIGMNGGTPLMLATVMGHPAVVHALIKGGADPKVEITADGKKLSAVSIAKDSGNRMLVEAMER